MLARISILWPSLLCVLLLLGSSAHAASCAGEGTELAVELLGGYEHSRFSDGDEAGGLGRALLGLGQGLRLGRSTCLHLALLGRGEHSPSLRYGDVDASLGLSQDLWEGGQGRLTLAGSVEEGQDTFVDLWRLGADASAEAELWNTTLYAEAGYRFDFDEAWRLPRHDRRHTAWTGLVAFLSRSPLLLGRMDVRGAILRSSDDTETRQACAASLFALLRWEDAGGVAVFGQYEYDDYGDGGWGSSVLLSVKADVALGGGLSVIVEYGFLWGRSDEADERLRQHRLLAGLRWEL